MSKSLAQQVKEAEALVAQLERGEPATPKQSHSVTLRNSHPGGRGKSLIEKIRDDLREVLGDLSTLQEGPPNADAVMEKEYLSGLVDGIAHALGILRNNDGETERRWAEAEYRESKRHGET